MHLIPQFRTIILSLSIFGSIVLSVDIIDHNICGPGISRDIILKTNLKTYTFYKLRLKRFPVGVITWTNQAHSSGSRFVQTDNGGSSKYSKEREWYFDSQWMFIPSKFHPGWYHLINRGIPGEYASFINTNSQDAGVNTNKYYVLLNPNYSTRFSSQYDNQFLWKPVQHEDGKYYQLQSKALPNTPVTWTEKKYLQNGHFIQLDDTRDARYEYGNEWFDDTLFSFQPVDDDIRLELSISKFELLDQFSQDNFHQVENVDFGTKVIFENNGSNTISQSYAAIGRVPERIQVARPLSFANVDKIEVEAGMEVSSQGSLPFFNTSLLRDKLTEIFSLQSYAASTNATVETIKEFAVNHQIKVPPCTRYEVSTFVKLIKDHPIDYVVHFKVTAKDVDQQQISEGILRSLYMTDGMEYVRTLDEYTVIAQVRGKMSADFGLGTVINNIGAPLRYPSCYQDNQCNELISNPSESV